MSIRFSVVTVVRNDLVGLQKSRQSLEAQTFTGWEHIIIDGNSNDGTFEYLNGLPLENTRFLSEPDNGIYDAMNKAWKMAEPENFIFYLNARDVFTDNDSLMNAVDALLAKPEANWGCTTHEEIEESGEGWVCKLVSVPSVQNQLFAFGYRSHQAVVMRARFISGLKGFDQAYNIAADWDLISKALLAENPVVWRKPIARFELGGMSSSRLLEAHMELREIRKKYLELSIKQKFFEQLWCSIYLAQFGYRNYLTPILAFLSGSPEKMSKEKARDRSWVSFTFFHSKIPGFLYPIIGHEKVLKFRRRFNIRLMSLGVNWYFTSVLSKILPKSDFHIQQNLISKIHKNLGLNDLE
jgi:glycosyltransferase involved in cell wall biosynthesis